MSHKSVHLELGSFRASVPSEKLRQWETPTGPKCLIKLFKDWAIIFAGHQLFIRQPSWATLLPALVLISWGQRGLSTLAHDSVHLNLFRNKDMNYYVANLALAPAAMSTAKIQRSGHNSHHWYLGTVDDPDHGDGNGSSLRHYRNRHYTHNSIWSLFIYDVLDFKFFSQHVMGNFTDAPFFLTLWWASMSFITKYLEPKDSAIPVLGLSHLSVFFMLFHLARCTFTYAFYVLREIIDHSGLPQDSVIKFTRSSPSGNLFQGFLQPHNDNFHLLHHLLPKVPMSRLLEVDRWLMANNAEYARANHYSNYFQGDNAMFREKLHQ